MKRMQLYRSFFIWILFAIHSELSAKNIQVPAAFKSIQAAIDAAVAGDVILVASGTYHERLRLKPHITLRSRGSNEKGSIGLKRAETVILDGKGKEEDAPGVIMAEGSILDGFTVTRMGHYDEAVWKRHWEEKGANQSHEHIGQVDVPGIAITGVTCSVLNNIVHHNGHNGITVRGEKDKKCSPLVSGNVCYRNMGGGIGSMNGSTALIEENTCFENFYAGIGHNAASPIVQGNTCYNNVRAGIGISNGASPIVRRNQCYRNRRAGIGIRTGSSTSPVVEENDCYENAMAGIGCTEESSPILRRNRCYKNKLAGIGCSDNASPIIEGNHCFENGAAGIGSESASPTMRNNLLEKNAKAGIGLSHKTNAIVMQNQCIENKLVAIGIRDGSQALLQGNTLLRTGGMPPIVAIFENSKVIMTDNHITGGGIAGVLLQGTLTANRNTLDGKGGANGIVIQKNSKTEISNNRITGYKNDINDQRDSNP